MAADSGSNRRFGVVIFDDDKDPGPGWAFCVGERAAKRISNPDELSTGVVWWSNVTYEFFFRKTEIWRKSWLRHDKYLVVSHADVLREWNYDPKEVGADFICQFVATLFDRVMRLAFSLLREADPRTKMDQAFVGQTLRHDMRKILPDPEYPKSEAASIMKAGQAFDEFTTTSMKSVRDSRLITLRKPRMLYAMEMLQTLIPHGPFEFMTRRDLRDKNPDRAAFIRDSETPCMAEITVERMAPEIAPIYGFGNSMSKDKRSLRSWVAHPEFIVIQRLAEIDVKSAWVGREYGSLIGELSESVKEFLADKQNEGSWSAGIIAETIWRSATLKEEKSKVGTLREGEDWAETSWQGAWIKAADKVSMFLTALDLAKMDYPVLSYGLGWVRCGIPEESLKDFINDGLSLGLVPNMTDIPDGLYDRDTPVHWGGDKRSHMFAHYQATKRHNLLWNLDRVPALPHDQRKRFIVDLLEKSKRGEI